ncbi:hypothetical protein AVMA1855_16085 [Acidovorax sp. SUPP1855]|uniref:hypothetical protein n=1 Tax=Acidovorax sp. SUPP1855 TaxID=431774 RepID=UPI0023DE4A35|nr:hypothetical protein [Acidovorax sp. SUPP1855]GKS85691.1 hypothetical protein AVMA1855_16085 [Acidovorax sp. SUPP1855]
MVHIKEITSPPRVARSVEERIQEGAPQRRSTSMSAATLGLQGRALALQTKPEDSGPPPTRRPPPPKLSRPAGARHREPAVSGTAASASATRAAALAEARAGKAKAVAVASTGRSGPPPVENTDAWRDLAAAGILRMQGYVGQPEKSVAENPAAMQIRIKRLQSMASLKADSLRFQSEMRKQMNGLDGSATPESYKKWVQAASVNLEAVFQTAEAAAREAHARLEVEPESDADSDTDVFMDARSDWDADVETHTEAETDAATEANESVQIDVEANVASTQSESPKSAASPRAGDVIASTQPVSSASSTEGSAPASPTHVASTAAAESTAALAQSAADEKRHETAQALLSLRTMNMRYHVSGVLELLENVQSMGRKIQNLEQVLATKDELLQGHGDLVEQLADETVSARLDPRQLKQWRDAAAMDPGAKFNELAASISDIKARMRNGVEHLTRIEDYSMAEIFPRSR